MEDFIFMDLGHIAKNLVLTKDLQFFDIEKRYYVKNDDKTILINSKRKSIKSILRDIFKKLESDPTELIENSKMSDEHKQVSLDVWNFYHHKRYPLKDFLQFTTFDQDDKTLDLDYFFITPKGLYSTKTDMYVKSTESFGKKIYYIQRRNSSSSKSYTVYFSDILEHLKLTE